MATKPGEHNTVQARILKYAHEIGWTCVPARAGGGNSSHGLGVLTLFGEN